VVVWAIEAGVRSAERREARRRGRSVLPAPETWPTHRDLLDVRKVYPDVEGDDGVEEWTEEMGAALDFGYAVDDALRVSENRP
jgi:hypothetical protein